MIASGDPASHEAAWLALPWLANGRLSQAERDKIEPHVRECAECREELAFQRLLCNTLTEPDRVTYAPGPSFRKLMDRIDGAAPQPRKETESNKTPERPAPAASRPWSPREVSLWRPPGLAWAASFVLMVGLAAVFTTANRSAPSPDAPPVYRTTTDTPAAAPNVLHIIFQGSLTIAEAEEVLRSSDAHIVEGPDSQGIFGVAPGASGTNKAASTRTTRELHVLWARLHTDPRVRWVEPAPGDDSTGAAEAPGPRGP
jgi:Putative zinc-finger